MPQHNAQATSDNEEQIEYTNDDLKPFISAAKWITRAVSPFVNLDSVIAAGLNGYSKADYECREDFDADIVLFDAIMALHDDFPELIEEFRRAPDGLTRFLRDLTHHMREARSQDTNAMKFAIISYLPLDPDKDVVVPPITGNQKSKRGWNHVWTARFLCPLKDREIFERNPHAYMKKVQEGKIKLRAKNLPSFLYEDGTVYCATREDKGLFRGHVVIRALRLIFTGESSAFTGHRSAARRSQAEIHGMREVTPEALAYACCQIYVNLSALEQWSNMDSYFDVEKFYKLVVGLFREPRSRWARDTLEFLTTQLPSLKRKAKRKRAAPIDDSEADESDSDPTGILAQQAARLDEDSDAEDTLRTRTPAPNSGAGHAEPPSPPESSPPVHQTLVRTQARTQASQIAQARPPPSHSAPRPSQPSQRPIQLSQSSPMRPQNVREPLAPLNGIRGHVHVSQSSPARPEAPQRSLTPMLRPPNVRRRRTLSVEETDGEEEVIREDTAPPEDPPEESLPPKTKRSYARKAAGSSKRESRYKL